MTDILDAIRILVLIVFVVFGNIIWYIIKNILSENGYEISWFRGHMGDLIDFSHLIDKTTNPTDRKNYRLLLRALIVILFSFVVTALSFLWDAKNFSCNQYEDYLKTEVTGQVIEKFINHSNHNDRTLTLEQNGERFNGIELVQMNSGLYDSIQIGDTINKLKGDSITTIQRSGRNIEFVTKRNDYCKD